MRKITVAVLLTFAFATSLMLAQTSQAPPQPPDPATRAEHHVKFLTNMLNLTAAQQQQATAIFSSTGTAATGLHESMKTARQNLDTAIKSNDAAAIQQAANTIGTLTAQMTFTEAKSRAAFYQILTPEQQAKLNQFESERHMHLGPGGPGHGPGMGFMPH